MWPRVVEIMLGCWLAVSPFVFGHGDRTDLWVADFTAATAVVVLGLLSYWHPARQAHLLTAVVGLAMVGFGYFWQGYPAPAALQNHVLIGLTLMLLAIIPNEASQPPESRRAKVSERFASHEC
jgi:hypothetical protein